MSNFVRCAARLKRPARVAVNCSFAPGPDSQTQFHQGPSFCIKRSRVLCRRSQRFISAHHFGILATKLFEPCWNSALTRGTWFGFHTSLLSQCTSFRKHIFATERQFLGRHHSSVNVSATTAQPVFRRPKREFLSDDAENRC